MNNMNIITIIIFSHHNMVATIVNIKKKMNKNDIKNIKLWR